MKQFRAAVVPFALALTFLPACGPRPPAEPGGVAIGEPPPLPPPGTPVDPATVEAWKQAGIVLDSPGSVEKGELPHFKVTRAVSLDTLARLPEPTVPFSLSFEKTYATTQGFDHLLKIKTLSRLYTWGFDDQTLGLFAAAGMHRLASARTADGQRPNSPEEVVELSLKFSSVTDGALVYLAGLKNLRKLDLSKTYVTDAGMKHLAGHTELTALNLFETRVSDAGLAQLAGANPRLVSLNLMSTRVTDAGMKHLAAFAALSVVDLSGTPVTDAGLVHFADRTTLTELVLPSGVTDAGLVHLARLHNLTTLDLSHSQVNGYDGKMNALSGLKRLTTLRVNRRVTDKAVAELKKALPQCEVKRS